MYAYNTMQEAMQEALLREAMRGQIQNSGVQKCIHDDCPVCRAMKEAEEVARKVKADEYKRRCNEYMKKIRENLKRRAP